MSSDVVGKKKRKNTSFQNPYVGKAGHLAVMSELAWRGYNVALPEIDIGDDIFVVDDRYSTRPLRRIQVKTAKEMTHQANSYQVAVTDSQINTDSDLFFVFALRRKDEDRWRFIVLHRADLKHYIDSRAKTREKFGSVKGKKGRRILQIAFEKRKQYKSVSCSKTDFTPHLDDWRSWPEIDHNDVGASTTASAASPETADSSAALLLDQFLQKESGVAICGAHSAALTPHPTDRVPR